MNDNKIKTIAFYLPQFHAIPENDIWWGQGFTEWTNTRKAVPLFDNHYQPRVPHKEKYYNLLDEGILEWQIKIAKEYGIYGFCYYHYWFKNGKKLLEKPIENMLNNSVNFPYCLCWANESWTKNWDGGNREIIVEQDYGSKADWEDHFQYLLNYFKDKRYITIDGSPLLIIYKPEQIPKLNEMLDYITYRIIQEGLPGIVYAYQYPQWYFMANYDDSRFKYIIDFEPVFTEAYLSKIDNIHNIKKKQKFIRFAKKIIGDRLIDFIRAMKINITPNQVKKSVLRIKNFDETWKSILSRPVIDYKLIPGAFVGWDNTPRNENGIVYIGGNPQKMKNNYIELIKKTKEEYKKNMIFINAWNEWAEGAYLEPDNEYGYKYLEAIRDALLEEGEYISMQ